MSSLYPSLEDMQVHRMVQAQQNAYVNQMTTHEQQKPFYGHQSSLYAQSTYPQLESKQIPITESVQQIATAPELYPGLSDFMGLELSADEIALNTPEYMQNSVLPNVSTGQYVSMVAPLSHQTVGLQRAQITHGIREVIVCKGTDKKVGLRVKDINNGIFIILVCKDSPAALVKLRFGDQILQINGENVAGFSMEKVHKIFKKCPQNNITLIIRDRPFERTVTMHKDSTGHIGFQFNNGKIVSIVKDSSAARNGLLIEHQLLEVNGQNVVGMKDKQITEIILDSKLHVVTVTIIPSVIYDHMMKKIPLPFIRGIMDHSIPDV